jgi:polysaccharide pyruvyl transferase CsaB
MIQKVLNNWLTKKSRIVIHGFYGAGNLGDEAILSAILSQISVLDNVKPVIVSNNPAETQRIHQVSSVNHHNAIAGYMNMLRANVYILGGGGLIKDYGESSRSIESWLHPLAKAQRFGITTILWSVGVENLRFSKSKELVRRVLNKANAITVRDPSSKTRLEEVGIQNQITVTADPAILLGAKFGKNRSISKNPRAIVCLRHWNKGGVNMLDRHADENLINSLAYVLDFMIKHLNTEIEFLPFRTISPDDDREVAKMVVSRMTSREHIICHSRVPSIDEAINILSKADILIGMRLHSVILATSLGIPSIGLSYMPKVRDYMNYIDQESFCFDIQDLDEILLRNSVEIIVNHYEEISKKLVSTCFSRSMRLHENVRILSDLLNKDIKI